MGEPARTWGKTPLATELRPLRFKELTGWADDDQAEAFAAFRRSAASLATADSVLRPAREESVELRRVASEALALGTPDTAASRLFFEAWFKPFEVLTESGRGFLTGYFEPVVSGSIDRTANFPVPLLARPEDLVTLAPGEAPPGFDPTLQAARRTPQGLVPYPDRGAIEDGELGRLARPVVHLADAVAVFMIQVQGSARIQLPDGRTVRAVYAGRNGRPYTSIGRLLTESGRIPLPEMSLERLTGWLRAHPADGRAVMRRNKSYVFFKLEEERDPAEGPIGGAGIPLTPGRSLAIDRARWSYGLPFWLEGELPRPDGGTDDLRRLMIAQDTGSAIVGAARGDYFMGSGPEAGTRAGLLRHPVRFVVLLPKGSRDEP